MNQEEADQDVADEVSEEADSRGKVMRAMPAEWQNILCGMSDVIDKFANFCGRGLVGREKIGG